jgi:hypothetical protein
MKIETKFSLNEEVFIPTHNKKAKIVKIDITVSSYSPNGISIYGVKTENGFYGGFCDYDFQKLFIYIN